MSSLQQNGAALQLSRSSIDTRGGANPGVPDDLRPKLAAALKDRENLVRGRSSTYYLAVSTPPREALPDRIAGIELDPAGFPHYFETVINRRRLLPRSQRCPSPRPDRKCRTESR